MPKNSFTTPVKEGHWNAAEVNPFELATNMDLVCLEAVPVAHGPIQIVLPPNPSDGDTYAWSDPLGLVSANYTLHVTTTDGRKVNNAAGGLTGGFVSTTANSSGRATFNESLDQWALVGAV